MYLRQTSTVVQLPRMALGYRIRKHRLHRGWTLEKLSELSGVETGTISALEQRDSTKSKFGRAIAAAFGISLDELESGAIPGEGEAPADVGRPTLRVSENTPESYSGMSQVEMDLLATYRALNSTYKSLLVSDAHKYLLVQTTDKSRKAS